MRDCDHARRLIENELPNSHVRVGLDWEAYHGLDEIYAWLDEQLTRYNRILSAETVGYSYHGTEIRAVRLSHKAVRFFSRAIGHSLAYKEYKHFREIPPYLLKPIFMLGNGLHRQQPHGF